MPFVNGQKNYLEQLIQSLTKAEKRNFKLYSTRNFNTNEDLKFIQVFDFYDKVKYPTDDKLIKQVEGIKKSQLTNLKSHLYRQILSSLRVQNVKKQMDLEIRELIDFGSILYTKGFYHQALKQLEKAKIIAKRGEFNQLKLQIVEFEKLIETQYITRSGSARTEELTSVSSNLTQHINKAVYFSNLSLELYALYLKVGFVRDEKENIFVREFFKSKMIDYNAKDLNFEERLHLYNAYVWYNYIIQDFVMCYKYALQWVELFSEYPATKESRMDMFLKGHHNLMNTLFNLRDYKRFKDALVLLENERENASVNDNVYLLYHLYLYTNRINKYFLNGRFSEGINIVPEIIEFLDDFGHRLDAHRVIVFYYKIACMYFGAGDNKQSIFYLNKVIQFKDQGLREDIQGFARILNLIAHFELGNDVLVEYQVRSVYRFLSKMGELHGVQKEIFHFLRQLPFANEVEMKKGFKFLLGKLVKLANDPFEKRAFLYLDIISWLESKLDNSTVQIVIREKAKEEQKTGVKLYFPK